MVNVAIVGAGFMGGTHLSAYQQMPDVRVTAICDKGEAAGCSLAEKAGCPWYGSCMELLTAEPQIDVVDICLPTFLHEESVILAAEFRKAIICEKPAALSREVFARMLDAVRKAQVALNVGHVIRYWPEYAYAKKLYDGGQFGNIRYARATRMSCVSARARKGGWFTKPDRSGGGLFDLHIHDVDYFCYLFGKVKSVYACGSRNSVGSWNYVCSTLNFENGISAVAEGISEMPQGFPFTMELNIVGDQQALCYHMGAGENLYNIHEAGRMTHVYSNEKEPETVCLEHPDAYFLELRDFIDHVKAGTPVEVITPEAVDYTLRVLAAIKQSLETGKVVSVME